MENPIFTFATPTVVSGDRQNVDVIARTYQYVFLGRLLVRSYLQNYVEL